MYIDRTHPCYIVCILSLRKPRRHLPPPLPPARHHDFFDAQTMDAIRHRAICLNLATHIESVGNGHSVVFQSTVSGMGVCSLATNTLRTSPNTFLEFLVLRQDAFQVLGDLRR